MDYIKIKTLDDVFFIDNFKNEIYALLLKEDNLDTKLLVKMDTDYSINSEIISKSVKSSVCFPANNYVYSNLLRGGGQLFDSNLNEIRQENYLIQTYNENKNYAACSVIINNLKVFGLLDSLNFNILWTKDFRIRYVAFDEDFIYAERYDYKVGSTIYCFKISDGEQKWESNLIDDRGLRIHITRIVGVTHKLLVASTTSGELILIEKYSGKIVAKKSVPVPEHSILSTDENVVWGLNKEGFWQYNLNNEEHIFVNLREEYLQHQIEVVVANKIGNTGHILFFCSNFIIEAGNGMEFLCKIGAFDIKKEKIIWTYKFDLEPRTRLQSPAPHIIEDKLFVLDSKNRLHIFQEVKS